MSSSVQVTNLIREWNSDLENYLKHLGEFSQIYSLLHKNSEKKYNKISYQFDIPNIVIATVAGTLSISSSGLFQGMEKEASIFIGILSLTSSILTTINSYFGFKKRSENHRLVSIQYQKLFLKIDLVLGLRQEERPNINEFIKFVTDEFNRLAEISPIIDKDLLKEFKNKFKDYKDVVAFPSELNGLSEITVYKTCEELMVDNYRNLKNIQAKKRGAKKQETGDKKDDGDEDNEELDDGDEDNEELDDEVHDDVNEDNEDDDRGEESV
jgi:hypothetical protein